MSTINYMSGEAGTLGFPIDDPTGAPMDHTGLDVRMVIYLSGADLTIPGYWSRGDLIAGGVAIDDHPSIAAFDIAPGTIELPARLYQAAVQINDGTNGWQTLPEGLFNLNIRRL